MKFALLLVLASIPSFADCVFPSKFDAYYVVNGVQHFGHAETTVTSKNVCRETYSGTLQMEDAISYPVEGSFKFCGWVGPDPIPFFNVTVPGEGKIRLYPSEEPH